MTEWAKAQKRLDDLERRQGRTVGLTFDDVADERNLRRELTEWLWLNAVKLIQAAEGKAK